MAERKELATPPQDFNWDELEEAVGFTTSKSPERAALEQKYDESLGTISERELVEGTIVGISDKDVIINVGFKSDGLVPVSEFREDEGPLRVGGKVEVFIEAQEDENGQLILSRRKAKILKAWEIIKQGLEQDNVLEGLVKRRTKGGLIVDVHGVEAFLPGSQVDVKPIRDFDVYVGKSMEVKVVKINYANDNVVVSHKVLIEKDIEKQKQEILNNLERGQVLEGTIKNMTNFGVFIDLGGVDGLLHITDISWGRISHPEEVLELDQKVKIVVLDFDDEKKRISLGMKQLTAHPWDSLPADMTEGSVITGRVVNIADYGAFVEIQPGVEGLIHVSEMSWSQHLRNPGEFLKAGDQVEARVLNIDREERKMSLGLKQLTEDPWTRNEVVTKYAPGTKLTGLIRNMTNFGIFVELEEGIDGLVHISDLSWTKKIKHPSEFAKVGDNIEIVVLELDLENRKISLGHKQLEENPWDTFESIFFEGSVHKATIIQKTEKGSVVELPYGVEGFASTKQLTKEDGSKGDIGEQLDFVVTEFNPSERKIFVSHARTHSTSAGSDDEGSSSSAPSGSSGAGAGKKRAGGAGASKTINKINKEVEATTLGDLAALSALKQQMDSGDEKPKKKAAPKPKAKAKEEEDDSEPEA